MSDSTKQVDERVLSMKFDNQQFEQNVRTTMSTLDKLKQSLKFDNHSKGLEDINSQVKSFDVTPMANGLNTVKLTLGEIAKITVFQDIIHSAENAAMKLKSFMTESVTAGFQEYELKMGSVQTIMASTGESLDVVNKYLEELNKYSDKTIYSFSDMTNNIGKFTNAGVKLEDAVAAIKGVSNEAAVSGANANEASRAMYNFAQALSAGYVKLIDWKSIENANMATVEFKNELLKTAMELKTVVKEGDRYVTTTTNMQGKVSDLFDATHGFNDALNHQWMTTEVLTKTLARYASESEDIGKKAYAAAQDVKTFSMMMDTLKEAAQSGWAQTWEILFGDFNEAKTLWTDLSGVVGSFIDKQSTVRNEMLKTWKELGGRVDVIESAKNVFTWIKDIVNPISESFRDIFPTITAKKLKDITGSFQKFTSNLKVSDETSKNLKSTFGGLFAAVDVVGNAFVAIMKAIRPFGVGIKNIASGVLKFTGYLGESIIAFDKYIKSSGSFQKAGENVAKVFEKIGNIFDRFKNSVKEKIQSANLVLFHSLLERIHVRMNQVGETAGNMKSGVVVALEIMGETLANCQFLKLLSAIWNATKTITNGILAIVGELGKSLASNIGGANFNNIIDLMNSLSFGAIAIGVTKFIGSFKKAIDDIGSFKKSLLGIFDSVRDCFEAYQTRLQAGTLLKIASAIAILSLSIIAISMIDSNKLNASLKAIAVLFGELVTSMAIIGKMDGRVKGATQMIIFAGAISILASACVKLSKLSWKNLAKGLSGVGALLSEVSLFMRTAKFSKGSISTSIGIVILASAIKVLASACADFGLMKWDEIGKGLASIGALLAELSMFTNLTGNAKHVISTGVALIAIGAAMKILASSMKDFGTMKWTEIAKGLASMAGALVLITASLNFMPKNIVSKGVGLIAVSAALLILTNVMKKMGSLSWNKISKGLHALGGSIAILAIGLHAMNGTLGGSAALMVAASALLLLTPVLSLLGAMSWKSIAKGLIAIAGAFVILGVAGAILSPLLPSILGLSASLALVGVSIVGVGVGLSLVGVGLSAIAVGFTALATAGIAGATAFVAAITVIITGIAGLIPAIAVKIGEAIVAFCNVIADSAGAIGEAVKEIVLTLVDVLVECVPSIADGALKLIAGVLEALVAYTPSIVDSIFKFLIELINGIAANLPELISATVNLFMAFFSGVVEALKGIDGDTLLKGIVGIGLITVITAALSYVAALIPGAMAGVLGVGAVMAEFALVLAAIGAMAQIPGLSWLIDEGGEFLQGVGTAIGKFIGGIVGGFASGISSQIPKIGSDLSEFMTNVKPFIEGASAIDASMMNGVKALSETILILTAAELVQGLTSFLTGGLFGNNSLSKFADELIPFGESFRKFAEQFDGINPDTVVAASRAAESISEFAKSLPKHGGKIQEWIGDNSLTSFAEELESFADPFVEYSKKMADVNSEAVEKSSAAANALNDFAKGVPKHGGKIKEWITGDNSLTKFAEELEAFADPFVEYSQKMANVNVEAVEKSSAAGEALTALKTTLPKADSLFSKLFGGSTTLTDLAEELKAFGEPFKDYSDFMKGVDANVVDSSTNAAKAIVELKRGLSDIDSGWWGNSDNLTNFGKDLQGFGDFFAAYYTKIQNIGPNQLGDVITQLRRIVDVAFDMQEINTNGMTNFGQSLEELGARGVDAFCEAFKSPDSQITTAMLEFVAKFTEKVSTMEDALSGKMTKIADTIAEALRKKYSDFRDIGTIYVLKMAQGMMSETNKSGNIMDPVTSSMVSSVRGKFVDFYNAGKFLVTGFVKGIENNVDKAVDAATALADATAKATDEALDIHSPSRRAYRSGSFYGQGFINSIKDSCKAATEASTEMAESAHEGLSSAIRKISDWFDADVDLNPTIRPIVDMSEAEAGSRRLRDLYGNMQFAGLGINLSANTRTMSSVNNSMDAINQQKLQNASNSRVVTALGDLKDEIHNMEKPSYVVNGITYDDGSGIHNAVGELIRAAKIDRRV